MGSAEIRFAESRSAVAASTTPPSADCTASSHLNIRGRRGLKRWLDGASQRRTKEAALPSCNRGVLWTTKAANGATVRRRSQQIGSSFQFGS